MISIANAIIDPDAVVIHAHDAHVTNRTMLRSGWPVEFTCGTLFNGRFVVVQNVVERIYSNGFKQVPLRNSARIRRTCQIKGQISPHEHQWHHELMCLTVWQNVHKWPSGNENNQSAARQQSEVEQLHNRIRLVDEPVSRCLTPVDTSLSNNHEQKPVQIMGPQSLRQKCMHAANGVVVMCRRSSHYKNIDDAACQHN